MNFKAFTKNDLLYIGLGCLLMIGALLFDRLSPLGIAAGSNYLLVILVLSFSKNTQIITAFSLIALLLILVGITTSYSVGIHPEIFLINRVISIIMLIAVTLIVNKLIQAEYNLKNSYDTFLSILDASPVGIFLIDNKDKIEYSNKLAQVLFKYTEDELMRMQISTLIHPSDNKQEDFLLSSYASTYDKSSAMELTGFDKEDSSFPVEVIMEHLTINGQQNNICSVYDITTRKIKEESILSENKKLSRSNEKLDAFAYIASHDLKEPLRGIQTTCTRLVEQYAPVLDKQGQEIIYKLPIFTQKLEALLDNLLSYARIDSTKLQMESVNLNTLISEISDDLSFNEKMKNANIVTHHALPSIIGDKSFLSQIFTNLIINAIKYNDNAVPTVEIGCISDDNDNEQTVTLYVKDNGIGIKPEHIDKIFTLFKRLNSRDAYGGGTGAGLTIVQKMVAHHQGKIWVHSTWQEGTTFFILFNKEQV